MLDEYGIDRYEGTEDIVGISFEKMNAFWEAKGFERPCPVCGETEWALATLSGDDDPPVVPLLFFRSVTSPTEGIASFSGSCGNCGHVQLIAHHIVEKWVTQNG